MKKFSFLLLDTGPIIKLFELGIWDDFIKRCDVTISRTVAEQAKWASQDLEDIRIGLDTYEKTIDLERSVVTRFHDKFDPLYKNEIHVGEKETLAFLHNSSEPWIVCSADKAVFRVLGLLGRGEQGISLEELTDKIGLQIGISWAKVNPRDADLWKFTKKFREKYTRLGQIDRIQGQGLV